MLTRADIVDYMERVATHTGVPLAEKECVAKHIRILLKTHLSPMEKEVYDIILVSDHEGVTYTDIVAKLGVSSQYACNILKRLHRMDLIIRGVDRDSDKSRWCART